MKFLPILDFDTTFHKSINPQIIPCTAEGLKTKKQVKEFVDYIFTDGDLTTTLATTCSCGESQGVYRRGTICPVCKTPVEDPCSTNLGYKHWLQIPDCLPPLLQPAVYHTLQKWMKTYKRQSLLDIFLNPEGVLPPQLQHLPTGVWGFYTHFDKIMETLLTEYKPLMIYSGQVRKNSKSINQHSLEMQEFLIKNRKAIFARHFPCLDKSIHVLTTHGTKSRTDSSSVYILKAALEISNVNLVNSMSPEDKTTLELGALEITRAYAKYSKEISNKNLLGKYGFIRRQLLGSRCHFTFRAVIVPITDLSMPDELHLGWPIAVQQYKLEILNLLINRQGMRPSDALLKHQRAQERYDPDVDDIFDTLIQESPYKGLPLIWGRNPTLIFGSIQLFFATKIKKGTFGNSRPVVGAPMTDYTVSMHAMSMKAPNADLIGNLVSSENGSVIPFSTHPELLRSPLW